MAIKKAPKKKVTPKKKTTTKKKVVAKKKTAKKVTTKSALKKRKVKKPINGPDSVSQEEIVEAVATVTKKRVTKKKKAAPKKKVVKKKVVPKKKKVVKKKVAKKKAAPKVKVPRKRKYLNNRDLLEQVILSKEQGKMSDKLAHMLITLCARYARRGNFANYSYNDDMQGYAMMMIVRTWASFKPEKSNNPFAYYTQSIKNSFIQFLNQEKRQRNIRDAKLVEQGMAPSYAYQNDQAAKEKAANEARKFTEDEDDHNKQKKNDMLKF